MEDGHCTANPGLPLRCDQHIPINKAVDKKENIFWRFVISLPDGVFSYQKFQLWYFLEGF
jgi:hypothetical protein